MTGRSSRPLGHDVVPVRFQSGLDAALPVEVSAHDALVDRVGPGLFGVAQRPGFGVMFIVHRGTGVHTIDFEKIELRASRVVLVRPGQVHQWHPGALDASIVMIRPEASSRLSWAPGRSVRADLDPDRMRTVTDVLGALEREQRAFTATENSVRLMTELTAVLLSVFDLSSVGGNGGELPPAYLAYVDAVEANLGTARTARSLIADLGYSERTVTRACRQVTGRSAKELLDERVVLEAKRLLAHTDRPLGDVGAQLGFSEPSNFNKFVKRHTSQLPSAFRRELRTAGFAAGL